jgi:hypothetical protein
LVDTSISNMHTIEQEAIIECMKKTCITRGYYHS